MFCYSQHVSASIKKVVQSLLAAADQTDMTGLPPVTTRTSMRGFENDSVIASQVPTDSCCSKSASPAATTRFCVPVRRRNDKRINEIILVVQ
ncbi:hypothetical protein BJX66DRAFT_317876 [Aspergillus keveii]|uniref:Uncharacterized protein n=1 Tax=Aspergillus keveii TaxID=714993 RepID=A0ABR4FKK7_9EURO